MSTKLTNTDHYPATPAQIMAMLQNSDYVQAKYAALGDIKFEVVEMSAEGQSLALKVDREVPSNLPDIAKKFLGETNHLIQTEDWGAQGEGYSATLDIDSPGKPIHITGDMTVVPVGDSESDWTVTMDIKASIPLVGGKVEKSVHGETMDSLAKEFEFNKGWLASH